MSHLSSNLVAEFGEHSDDMLVNSEQTHLLITLLFVY